MAGFPLCDAYVFCSIITGIVMDGVVTMLVAPRIGGVLTNKWSLGSLSGLYSIRPKHFYFPRRRRDTINQREKMRRKQAKVDQNKEYFHCWGFLHSLVARHPHLHYQPTDRPPIYVTPPGHFWPMKNQQRPTTIPCENASGKLGRKRIGWTIGCAEILRGINSTRNLQFNRPRVTTTCARESF